jgi:hypothetical protein
MGKTLDGRTGYHVFFFMKALERLSAHGRLAFIMPADTCEGVFASTLWKWVLNTYRLDAVVTFDHAATPFPNVDTNAVIFMISADTPEERFKWCRCNEVGSALMEWVENGFPEVSSPSLVSLTREVTEGLETGLSRPQQERHVGPVLGDFVRTVRGVATGSNEFFFMTAAEAAARDLPLSYFVRAVGRTRDVEGDSITIEHLNALDAQGRPTYLLSLDSSTPERDLPDSIQRYLQKGAELGLPNLALIKQRKPWYKMEKRQPPPYLFAYLGRRNARFIRNKTNAVPLTGFLCVYFREIEAQESVWRLLNHPDTIANLSRVAKSYGAGAIKVEPRALERVPLSESALRDSGVFELRGDRQSSLVF